MGVLVGTSLIVIIPEGVDTLYSASQTGHAHVRRASSSGVVPAAILHASQESDKREAGDVHASAMSGPAQPDTFEVPPSLPIRPEAVNVPENVESKKGTGGESQSSIEGDSHNDSPHAWIGVALISGFILMHIIDKLPQYTISSKSAAQPYHISLNDLGRGPQREPSSNHDTESDGFLQNSSVSNGQSHSFATTTGLVIHAAADGIALGASSSAANTGLSFIIFIAIMVHKAPAAFGLTSVLLRQGLSKRTARAHLLLFSLAAPIGAILTWLFARSLGAETMQNAQNTKWWTAMLLLFSGGTFLYVAMHTMQEVGSSHEPQMKDQANGASDGRDERFEPQQSSPKDLVAAIIGMILPLFLQIGHAH
jgi:solute carrier family 39 (zinc transporter), member 9